MTARRWADIPDHERLGYETMQRHYQRTWSLAKLHPEVIERYAREAQRDVDALLARLDGCLAAISRYGGTYWSPCRNSAKVGSGYCWQHQDLAGDEGRERQAQPKRHCATCQCPPGGTR